MKFLMLIFAFSLVVSCATTKKYQPPKTIKQVNELSGSIVYDPYNAEDYALSDKGGDVVESEGRNITQGKAVNPMGLVDLEQKVYRFTLYSGLLKPQLETLVNQYLPDHIVYWGNYEGKHEWLGETRIEGESLEELLNIITSSYGKPPKGISWIIHKNAVEFIYKSSKG